MHRTNLQIGFSTLWLEHNKSIITDLQCDMLTVITCYQIKIRMITDNVAEKNAKYYVNTTKYTK